MSVKDEIPAVFLDKLSPKGLETIQKCKEFVEEYCLPADKIFQQQLDANPENRWKEIPPVLEKLKQKAKELGLWNMFLPKLYPEGPGFTNVEYGLMAEYLGRSATASLATNNAAPDTGNMEILAKFGNQYQKDRWLKPLLNGDIRSAFLMTEKGTSSSNALNISCSAKKNSQGNYVLNGYKWFASGAGDPRCDVWLVMCKTGDSSKDLYRNHTVLVIDAKKALATGKAKLLRPLTVFGYDDAPHGHNEVQFIDYEVCGEDMPNATLSAEGRGFEIIQSRLGPGRLHHCMRLIGAGEFALMRVIHRANHRVIFGKPMNKRELFLNALAQHKIDIQKCKLLVLDAAHKVDIAGTKLAMKEIAYAKIETPRTILTIIDWGIQMFGAEGVSQDTELAQMYAHNRTLRIADGPDEAHLGQLARREAKYFGEIDKFFAAFDERRQKVLKL